MGQLCSEPLLAAEARLHAIEQAIERRRELAQLVMRLAGREPLRRPFDHPLVGEVRHARDGRERTREDPARGQNHHREQHDAEQDRADQRDSDRALVGRQRHAGDDDADVTAIGDDRLRGNAKPVAIGRSALG